MPINTIISLNKAQILVWEITESNDELIEQLQDQNFDFAAFENIRSPKRKQEFLGVRLAMKKLLGKSCSILYQEDGKPYLQDNVYHISISHSNKWIAVMADPCCAVGIDIECLSDKIKKVYTRFLSKTEQEELYGDQDHRKLQIAWSAKEALYKIIGKEAVDFANQLHVFPFESKAAGQIKAEHLPSKKEFELSYLQTEAYTLAYCKS